MTDRPILFSAPMVRALLDDRKTQTRRILKPQPERSERGTYHVSNRHGGCVGVFEENVSATALDYVRWQEGDRLWVRESFWIAEVAGQGIGVPFLVYDEEWTDGPGAKEPKPVELRDWPGSDRWGHKPGIHMPRWASRLTLAVTDVRVQRLQDINLPDLLNEGVQWSDAWRGFVVPGITHPDPAFPVLSRSSAREMYAALWDVINGSGAWLANPWIVALTFTVERRNIDA